MQRNKWKIAEVIYPGTRREKWDDNERNFYRVICPRNPRLEFAKEVPEEPDESDLVTREA